MNTATFKEIHIKPETLSDGAGKQYWLYQLDIQRPIKGPFRSTQEAIDYIRKHNNLPNQTIKYLVKNIT